MAMFSDFSLKTLIATWDEETLGPKPLEKVGTTSSEVDLRFKNEDLQRSPSAQLQIIGDLAENGHLNVHTLGGTIVYGVDSEREETEKYELQVLTIASNNRVDGRYSSKIGEYEGAAGHVLLSYPSGGKILTSMVHWIELLKVDTSEKTFFEVARQRYG